MDLMQRLAARWERRESGIEPFDLTRSITIGAPADVIYDFVLDPGTTCLTGDRVLNSFWVPGVQPGTVGAQSCLLIGSADAVSAVIWEVTHLEPSREIRERCLSVTPNWTEVYTITPDSGGRCLLTITLSGHFMVGQGQHVLPALTQDLENTLLRTRSILESGVRWAPGAGASWREPERRARRQPPGLRRPSQG